MFSFLSNPTTATAVELFIVFQVYSAFVQSLPDPAKFGGIWYASLHSFLSLLAADFKSYAANFSTSAASNTTAFSTNSGAAAGE